LIVKDIHEINFSCLRDQGIHALILDIDDTLIPRTTNDISPQVFEWVVTRKEEGFKLCLTSNSRHPLRVKYIGETLEVPAMHLSFKPLPFAFLKSLEILSCKPEKAAMIGDQLFMDILGANLVGIYSVYVKHLTEETFLPRIWMRSIEEWLIKK
jgi:HAD superfamily phosphatase (TIGR01668 family)